MFCIGNHAAAADSLTPTGFPLAAMLALAALALYFALRLRAERARRLQAEREAAESTRANRAKNRFLERLSTAFRAPLNVILGFAQLQKSQLEPDAPAEAVRSIEATLEAGWRLLELLDDIVDIAQLEQKSLRVTLEDAGLQEVIDHAMNLVKGEARLAEVSLEAEPTPLVVRADYTRLKQIFVSLVRNAVQYNRPDGNVRISAELSGDTVLCRVEDTGPGIPETELSRILEPFERLPAGEQAHPEGTGTGLAIARLLCELMGGSLEVESTPGKGSTFTLRLPASQGTANAADGRSGEAPASPPAQQLTVIYVEDHSASIELMKAIMEPLDNVRLFTTATSEEGIALAREHRPDLILLDINLSGMDGITAARQIRADPEIGDSLLVALSADASEANVQDTLAAGFDEFLAKPLDIDRLWTLLQDAGR